MLFLPFVVPYDVLVESHTCFLLTIGAEVNRPLMQRFILIWLLICLCLMLAVSVGARDLKFLLCSSFPPFIIFSFPEYFTDLSSLIYYYCTAAYWCDGKMWRGRLSVILC